MGKRSGAVKRLALLAVVIVVAWLMIRASMGPTEPVYSGKPLSAWLVSSPDPDPEGLLVCKPDPMDSGAAIRQIGTNAIPFLLVRLQGHDSRLHTLLDKIGIPGVHLTSASDRNDQAAYGFYALGPAAARAVPDLMRIMQKGPDENARADAEASLGFIGPRAAMAVPLLLKNVTSTNERIRTFAILALGRVHS